MLQKRVRIYLNKINQAADKLDLQNSKRTLDIDIVAANRFISSAIPELTSEQRQRLKEVRLMLTCHSSGSCACSGRQAHFHTSKAICREHRCLVTICPQSKFDCHESPRLARGSMQFSVILLELKGLHIAMQLQASVQHGRLPRHTGPASSCCTRIRLLLPRPGAPLLSVQGPWWVIWWGVLCVFCQAACQGTMTCTWCCAGWQEACDRASKQETEVSAQIRHCKSTC